MDEVSRLLADLVSIPSVNPMGANVDGPIYLETTLSSFIERWLEARGIAVERQSVSPGRDNLLARFESSSGGPTILFARIKTQSPSKA